MDKNQAYKLLDQLENQVKSVIFGQEALLKEMLSVFLAEGHMLMTGAPGLAKTTLVKVLAEKLGLQFSRIQFTPDLLPSDILGSELLNIDPETGARTFKFNKGPVFTNLLLADEINRASPRTQSALLEAMQEKRVTVAGKTYPLPEPFMVFATQNPFETEGTFPLPEAQLDRFLLHSLVDYPEAEAEQEILKAHAENRLLANNQEPFQLPLEDIKQLIQEVRKIQCPESIVEAIQHMISATRPDNSSCPEEYKQALWYGAGPRAGLSIISAAKSFAFLEKEETVRFKHIQAVASPSLRHRVKLTLQAENDETSMDRFIDTIIKQIEKEAKF